MEILNKFRKRIDNIGVVFIFIVLFTFASIAYGDKSFLTFNSIMNYLKKCVMDGGFLALGMTVVLITGGIDLSVGSVMALSGIACAACAPFGLIFAILAGLLTGTLIGYINGLLVSKLKVVPFIATFAVMLFVRAVAYQLTGYGTLRVNDKGVFTKIANSCLFGIPTPVIIFAVCLILMIYITIKTPFGLRLFAIGDNEEASRMMGLRVNRIKTQAYVVCALFGSLSGILTTSRVNAGASIAAEGWEMTAIACSALGGVSLAGGKGKYTGVLFGTLIIGIISTIFNYQGNINTWWRNIIMGMLLLVSVMVQSNKITDIKNQLRMRKE